MHSLRTVTSTAIATAAAVLLIDVPAAQASSIGIGDKVRLFDREGSTGGGEFGLAKLPNASTELFRTFCVQTSEYLDFNAAGFTVAGIGNASVVAGGSVLTPETAFLYTAFRAGTLPGYDYTLGSPAHVTAADNLQKAIWKLEGEANGATNAYYQYAKDAVDSDNTVRAGNLYGDANAWVGTGSGNVRILNLQWATTREGHAAGTSAQDVLVLVPTPDALIGGLGLIGGVVAVGVARIRRRTEI